MSRFRCPLTASVLASMLIASPAGATTVPAPATPPMHEVRLLFTGFTGGLGDAGIDFAELVPLFEKGLVRDFEVAGLRQDAAYRQGDFILFTDAGPLTLNDFRSFFEQGPLVAKPLGPLPMLSSDSAFVLTSRQGESPWLIEWLDATLRREGRTPDTHYVTGGRYEVTNQAGVKLSLLSLTGQPPDPHLFDDPSAWEMLQAGAIRARGKNRQGHLLAISRPLGDGLRRARLLSDLQRDRAPITLTLDAGNLIDAGASTLSAQRRAFTFHQIASLHYDAVVPAENELALARPEWEQLNAEVPLLAANLKANEPHFAVPPGHMFKTIDGLKVALIGLIDDQAVQAAGAAGPQTPWEVTDPIEALAKEMKAVREAHPDATVVLTNVRDDRLQRLRHEFGVSAVIGDFYGLPGEVFKEAVQLEGDARPRAQAGYLITHSSRNRVGELTLDFLGDRPALKQLFAISHLVTDKLPEDVASRWQLNLTLDRYQEGRRELLLPDLRDAIAVLPHFKPAEEDERVPGMESRLWGRLVGNLMRKATVAEVAIARTMPASAPAAGPISQLTLENWLSDVDDHLVQTTLSGKTLKDLAERDQDKDLLVFSGFDPDSGTVNGAPINDDELYRVTTTDMVFRHAIFGTDFDGRPNASRWQLEADGTARPATHGKRTELRALVIQYLKALKARYHDAFSDAYLREYGCLLAGPGQTHEARWTFRLDDGQLLFDSYGNSDNPAYARVLNTRVTTPSSLSLGGKGKLAMIYDSSQLAWENDAKAIYHQNTAAQNGVQVTQRTDNQIVLTSELRLRALGLLPANADENALPWLMPYVNTNYTTQFVPDANADGTLKPRQSDLNAVGGLVWYPGFGFKELRLGGVVKNDFAIQTGLEPGIVTSASFEKKLQTTVPSTLDAGLDVTHYFNTPYDTPDRLGLLADLNAALVIPLWDKFNFTISADWFVYQGKLPQTSQLGSSLDFKLGLGYSLGFKPFYGLWY